MAASGLRAGAGGSDSARRGADVGWPPAAVDAAILVGRRGAWGGRFSGEVRRAARRFLSFAALLFFSQLSFFFVRREVSG